MHSMIHVVLVLLMIKWFILKTVSVFKGPHTRVRTPEQEWTIVYTNSLLVS